MLHLVPGDPVMLLLGDQASAEDIAELRSQLGLDRPLVEQYLVFVRRALQGDLGTSLRSGRPVLSEIQERFPATLQLTLAAIGLATTAGLLVGIATAVTRRRGVEFVLSVLPLIGLSLPTFWSGLLLISVFSLQLGWLPVVGDTSWRSLILPSIALALPTAAVVARMTRAQMLDALSQDYVRTANAKGLSQRAVVYKHALKAALIPVVTVLSLHFGALLGGAIIVESVFARPGLGRLAVNAILNRDFPVVQGVVLVSAVVYVFINLLAEFVYTLLDPRVARS
jgi:ABC-type dipeptide/oligopeptide/nickel transport system permease component